MQEIEVELQQGRNAKLIDLFDLPHARKVLYEFGRNYGALPAEPADLTKQQKRFIKEAVEQLAQQGRVISIRLAVFAEMFRDKPWTLAELSRMGGAQGVGYKFLESSFDAVHANPQHKAYKQQARLLLEALMPNEGQHIRGRVLPAAELQQACGLVNRPSEFSELVCILDKDLRLITPTKSLSTSDESLESSVGNGVVYYQLTHDFLVGSLRDWLTQNKRATRRGRAELKLTERSEAWTQKPERRQLPSGLEFITIRLLTQPSRWTTEQTRMMSSAARYYGKRWGSVALLFVATSWTSATLISIQNADNLVEKLLQADTIQVPEIVKEMQLTSGVSKRLAQRLTTGPLHTDKQRLHLELALLGVGSGNNENLKSRLGSCSPNEILAITRVTGNSATALAPAVWNLLDNGVSDAHSRVTLNAALAQWDATSPRWSSLASQIVDDLISLNATDSRSWSELLRPINSVLLPPIVEALAEADHNHAQLMEIYQALDNSSGVGVPILEASLNAAQPHAGMDTSEFIRYSTRQARIAVTLIGLGIDRPALWQFLQCKENMTRRSAMIELFHRFGVAPKILVSQLGRTNNAEVLAGLMLSLGSWRDKSRLPTELIEFAEQAYLENPNSAVHSAAQWLLNSVGRKLPENVDPPADSSWKLLAQNLTMVRMVPPAKFRMSAGVGGQERLVEIGRPYSISTTEIPIELYRQFDQEYAYPVFDKGYSSEAITGHHPATGLDWYMAANFCNWLTLQQGMSVADCCFVMEDPTAETSSQSGTGSVTTPPPTIKLVDDWRERKGFRMPTEAEWEYSCQTEMPTVWSCGWSGEPTILGAYAWYRDSINDEYSTRRVASLKPNSLGLFDMHGNANEITLDQQSNAFPDDVNGVYFAVKGGAYFSPNFNLTPSAIRRSPLHAPNYGFRIVQSE